MAIETAKIMPLQATVSAQQATGTIDLGQPRPFLAWITVNMLDPHGPFDDGNAIAADIFSVDGKPTTSRVFGGHFGPLGDNRNVFQGAFFGVGQRIEFWLRVWGSNVGAAAECVVVI